MRFGGAPEVSMGSHCVLWGSRRFYGALWGSRRFCRAAVLHCGALEGSAVFSGCPVGLDGSPEHSVGRCGVLEGSVGLYGVP